MLVEPATFLLDPTHWSPQAAKWLDPTNTLLDLAKRALDPATFSQDLAKFELHLKSYTQLSHGAVAWLVGDMLTRPLTKTFNRPLKKGFQKGRCPPLYPGKLPPPAGSFWERQAPNRGSGGRETPKMRPLTRALQKVWCFLFSPN